MKKAVMIVGILFLLVFIEPAFGQHWRTVAKAEVPFEFVLGSTSLPAGTYHVRLDSQRQMLSLFNPANGLSAIALVHNTALAAESEHANKLAFAFDGQRHVLHQVVVNTDKHIHDVVHGPEIAELSATPST